MALNNHLVQTFRSALILNQAFSWSYRLQRCVWCHCLFSLLHSFWHSIGFSRVSLPPWSLDEKSREEEKEKKYPKLIFFFSSQKCVFVFCFLFLFLFLQSKCMFKKSAQFQQRESWATSTSSKYLRQLLTLVISSFYQVPSFALQRMA